MFKKLNSKLGLTFLVVIALLIVGVGYILTTSNSDSVKSARQNSSGKLVESDDVVIERAGNWTVQESTSASGDNYLYSSGSPDDVLTLTFVGSRVEVIYTAGTNLGTLAVDVDHTVLRTVITDDQATKYQQNTVVDYLDDGLHTLRIYAQEGGVIGIDAFRVSRATQEAIIVNENKLADGVLEAVHSQDKLCIDVTLQDPQPNFGNTRGEERNSELLTQIEDQVLSNIDSGDFELIGKYASVAAFSGYADLLAILDIQGDPLVININISCVPIYPELSNSVSAIQASLVQSVYGISGEGMVVAVIDTGVDIDHPDLSDDFIYQICVSPNRIPSSGI